MTEILPEGTTEVCLILNAAFIWSYLKMEQERRRAKGGKIKEIEELYIVKIRCKEIAYICVCAPYETVYPGDIA